jgi:hypothetical protein
MAGSAGQELSPYRDTCWSTTAGPRHPVQHSRLRAVQDFNYEFEMHGINCDVAPEINTVFPVAPPEFQFISSIIKELATHQSPASTST